MKKARDADLHGLLVVNKPPHYTSHDVVARIRRWTGIRRVGHAGTLDPFATGVVVVAVGAATRVLQYVQDTDKYYLARVMLGAETDSADVDGQVVARTEPAEWPSREVVEKTLQEFVGTIEQIPPIYSAIKVGGQPLYRQARAGKDVTAPPRTVDVYAIELLRYEPPELDIAVHCGKGTYIRSLARDIGSRLGTFGYCHALRRKATGAFCLEQAWEIDELLELEPHEHWREIALHPDFALAGMDAVILSGAQEKAWYHGQSVGVAASNEAYSGQVRVYGPAGAFVGIGSITDGGTLKPSLVFNVVDEDEQE